MNRKTNNRGDYGLRTNYKARLTFFFRGLFCLSCVARVVAPGPKQSFAAPDPRGIRGVSQAVEPLRGAGRDPLGPWEEGEEEGTEVRGAGAESGDQEG